MLSMKIESMVNAMVKQELVKKGGNDKALHFAFDAGLYYHTGDERYSVRRGLHMLYHLFPGWGSVSVFSAITDDPFAKVTGVKVWKHETTHDSEWRSANTYTHLYFKMAEEINRQLSAAKKPEVAPAAMEEHNSPPIFDQMYDWVAVKVTIDPTDTYRHRRLVVLV